MMWVLSFAAGVVSLALAAWVGRRSGRWIVRMLRPRYVYGYPARSIVWLERLRTAGMLGVAAVYLVYLGASTDLAFLAAALRIQDGMRSLPAILLAMLLLVVVTRRGLRAAALMALGRPLAALLLVVAFAAGIIVAVNTIDSSRFGDVPDPDDPSWATVRHMLTAGAVLGLLVTFVVLTVVVSYLAVRHWCRTADAHPMLPATTTIIYAAMSAGWYLYDGVTPGVPATVDRLIALGGPAVLVLLASIELSILRRQGMTLTQPPRQISSAASRPRGQPS
jgi:hypothetical protein